MNQLRNILRFLGIIPASFEYQRGIMKARELQVKTGKRFYLIWDPATKRLRPLSYHGIPGRADSYQYLRHRGKFDPMSITEFQKGAFFFTRSKYKDNEMPKEMQKQHLELLRRRYFTR